jgi:hypothetical protein
VLDLPSRELSNPNDLAGAHGEDPGFPPFLEVQAAALAAAAPGQRNYDLVVTDRYELLGPIPPVVRDLVEASTQPANSVVSLIAPGVRQIGSDLPVDVLGEEIEQRGNPPLLHASKAARR